ncbi:MAG: hypothetical protein ACP5SI_09445 [Chloroflexia bacterium]
MRLWIECAVQNLVPPGESVREAVRTFQTEDHFHVVLVGAVSPAGGAEDLARLLDRLLQEGRPPKEAAGALLSGFPMRTQVPFSLLRVQEGRSAELLECDAPPLFLVRRGHLVLLPVEEEEFGRQLLRRCSFRLQVGDRMAMVSEGFIRARGWSRRWSWQDVALVLKRLADTGGDAEELLGALVRTYRRISGDRVEREATVVAMHVRPMRTVTVWSGPPADPREDRQALAKFLAEPGRRVICGDTTAKIAARLLGAELRMEERPADGWMEVPPTSTLEGVDLVTEGLVTMRAARRRLQEAARPQDLPRRMDGATRLARLLWEADVVRFLVGMAVNPAQTADGAGTVPLRRIVVEELAEELRRKGKVVRVEYLG